jgi:glycosyltransferase involved in cell wall biosynthesis
MIKLLPRIRRLKPDLVFTTLTYINLLSLLLRPLLPSSTAFVAREANIPSRSVKLEPFPWAVRIALRLLYPHFARIVCQSNDMSRDLVDRFGIAKPKITVIPNPVDGHRIRCQAARSPARLPPAVFNLIAVGRLCGQKGFDLLLRAFQKLDSGPGHLTIVGSGPDRILLETLARSLNIDRSVTFAGYLGNPYPQMNAADVYVLASRFEGFPNVLLEAGCLGLPVAAFDCPGDIGRIVIEGVTGHTAARENPADLARAIGACLRRRWDRRQIQELTERRYGIRRIKSVYETMLIRAANRRSPRLNDECESFTS